MKSLLWKIINLIEEKFHMTWIKRAAIKLYLKSPRKVQISLAKLGVKFVVHKKTEDLKKSLRALT